MTPPAKARPATQLSEETINKMISTQTRDQELKAQELSIRQQELKSQAEFAGRMLEAQVGNLQNQRVHDGMALNKKLLASAFILLVLIGFLVYAISKGYADQAFEFAKLLVAAVVGAFGGYGFKTYKDRASSSDESD